MKDINKIIINTLVNKSVEEYNNASPDTQAKMIAHVEKSLKVHDSAINSIGIGSDLNYVTAGKKFLKKIGKVNK